MSFPQGGYGFQNAPVTGDGVLVVPALRSPNFGEDDDGNVTGWSLNGDGSATFTNVTVGNDNFFIDMGGDASFNNASIDGELTVGGDTFSDILANYSRGVIALNTLPNDSATWDGTNPVLFARIVIQNFDATRQYKLCGHWRFDMGTSGPFFTYVQVRSKWNSAAGLSDFLFCEIEDGGRDRDAANDWALSFQYCFANTAPEGDLHLAFYFSCNAGNTGQKYQGTSYGRVWVEDAGPIVDYGTFSPSGGGTAPPQKHVSTFNAQWGTSYRGGGATCGSDMSRFNQNGVLYQGYYSSCNANTRSWIGFNWDLIQSTLSGATVSKCELYLKNKHWYFNGGGTAIIGTHNSTFLTAGDTGPGYNGDLDNLDRLRVSNWSVGSSKWVNLGTTIGNEFKNGTTRGIALGPGLSTSHTYYGQFYDATGGGQPVLRFTYYK